MSFFSDLGKSISTKSKELSQKAKIMSETSSLNNIVKGEECKIEFQYKAIGKLYFEKYGDAPSEEFAEAIEAIKSSKEKIEQTKAEIVKVRSRFNCPSCGVSFKYGSVFCPKCGAKLPNMGHENTEMPENAQKCGKCGNILKKNALFCNVCGSSLEKTIPELPAPKDEPIAPETVPADKDKPIIIPTTAEVISESAAEPPVKIAEPETNDAVAAQPAETIEPETDNATAAQPAETIEPEKNDTADAAVQPEPEKAEAAIPDTEKPEDIKPEVIKDETEKPDDAIPEEAAVRLEIHTEEIQSSPAEPQKRICKNCGNELFDDDIFCNECGTKYE